MSERRWECLTCGRLFPMRAPFWDGSHCGYCGEHSAEDWREPREHTPAEIAADDQWQGELDRSLLQCPDWDQIDTSRIAVTYDRLSDTLLVHLYGRHVPSVSVPLEMYDYALVSFDGWEVNGVQIEGFLSHAIRDEPNLIKMLDVAELRGITPAEVWDIRSAVVQTLPNSADAVSLHPLTTSMLNGLWSVGVGQSGVSA